jgi:hypothetical protein
MASLVLKKSAMTKILMIVTSVEATAPCQSVVMGSLALMKNVTMAQEIATFSLMHAVLIVLLLVVAMVWSMQESLVMMEIKMMRTLVLMAYQAPVC